MRIVFMTNISKYDVIVVKFPFASSMKYKARPAVVISSDMYNANKRNTLLIMAVSSSQENRLGFEADIEYWKGAGLLKPSIFKSAIATIEKEYIITKIGHLSDKDIDRLSTYDKYYMLNFIDKEEFTAMVKAVRDTEKLLGRVDYSMTEKKRKSRQFSRSLYVAEDIKVGEVITEKNIRSVRPGYGLHPKYLKDILGKKQRVICQKVNLFNGI